MKLASVIFLLCLAFVAREWLDWSRIEMLLLIIMGLIGRIYWRQK